MANTYTQIHIHFVFVVKYRTGLISHEWKDELYKYIAGILRNNNQKLICINGVQDHIHLLIGLRPEQSISDLVKDIKSNASRWINSKGFLKTRFEWQEGYGAFSYSRSQINDVIKYINNQEQHHKHKTFREEYIDFLKKFEIDYKEEYIFKELQ